jgi:hypothetical protein
MMHTANLCTSEISVNDPIVRVLLEGIEGRQVLEDTTDGAGKLLQNGITTGLGAHLLEDLAGISLFVCCLLAIYTNKINLN